MFISRKPVASPGLESPTQQPASSRREQKGRCVKNGVMCVLAVNFVQPKKECIYITSMNIYLYLYICIYTIYYICFSYMYFLETHNA